MTTLTRLLATTILLAVTACSSDADPYDPAAQAEREKNERITDCTSLSKQIFDLTTERDVAQTDRAIAQAASEATTEVQRREFQGAMEREMGLAPGEGKAWRSVAKNRAKVEGTQADRLQLKIDELQAQLDKQCAGILYQRF